MNEKDIIQQHSTIVQLILSRRLKEALKKLESQINLDSTIELRNEHNQISTSYEYIWLKAFKTQIVKSYITDF